MEEQDLIIEYNKCCYNGNIIHFMKCDICNFMVTSCNECNKECVICKYNIQNLIYPCYNIIHEIRNEKMFIIHRSKLINKVLKIINDVSLSCHEYICDISHILQTYYRFLEECKRQYMRNILNKIICDDVANHIVGYLYINQI